MSEYMTRWGYSVNGGSLPPIIDADEFDAITGGVMSSAPERIEAVLDGVSQAVRDFCGWHVAPVLECSWTGQGEGRLMVLPCISVRSVTSLTVDGTATEAFEWLPSGLVRLQGGCFPDAWRSAVCGFVAGEDAAGALAMAVSQIAANQLAAAAGVRSERAGQVSIDYNQTANGVSGGVRLLDSDMRLLMPYRITAR